MGFAATWLTPVYNRFGMTYEVTPVALNPPLPDIRPERTTEAMNNPLLSSAMTAAAAWTDSAARAHWKPCSLAAP